MMQTLKFLKKLSQTRSRLFLQDSSKIFSLSSYQKSFFADRKSDKSDEKAEPSQEAQDEAERYSQFADPLSQEFTYSSKETENFIYNTKKRGEEIAKMSGSTLAASKEAFKYESRPLKETKKSVTQEIKDTVRETATHAIKTGSKTRDTSTLRDGLRGVAQAISERLGSGFGTMGGFARNSADNCRPEAPTGKEAIGAFAPGSYEVKPKAGPGLGGLGASEFTREKPDLRASAREEQKMRGGMYSKTGNTQTGYVPPQKAQSAEERQSEREELRRETQLREPELSRERQKPGKEMIDLRDSSEWSKIMQSDKPIIVDFYKHGSGDCRRLYPHLLDRFTQSRESWVLVGADIENMKDLAREMKVESVPTVMLIHKGKVLEKSLDGNVDYLIQKATEISRNQ